MVRGQNGMGESNREAAEVKGHDAPLWDREQDDYNRWPIAAAISSVISTSPAGWATRVAVYGRWGDGKTTVLNFLEAQQREKENVVVRFAPWGASNETELWTSFSKALRLQLKLSGLRFGVFSDLWHWLKRRSAFLPALLKGGGYLVQHTYQVQVAPKILDAAASGLTKFL